MNDKNTDKTEIFKQRVIAKFGDCFGLDKVNYVNSKTHVTITCPIHGDFEVTPNNFLTQSKGCPKCVKERVARSMERTLEDIIAEAMIAHNGKYSYEKSKYQGMDKEMVITCPIHGDFKQIVSHHLNGHGCPKCARCNKKTTEEFKQEFIAKFGNDFDLSKVEYKGNKELVTIICPKHGEFQVTPNHLLSRTPYACPKCALENRGIGRRKPFSQFLEEARAIHGGKYLYDESTYRTTHDKMRMICQECGTEFWQSPKSHIGKEHNGCPTCARKLVGLKCRKPYDKFLEEAHAIHGDKYIYHEDYVNAGTKIRITCKKHGDFYQRPFDHICGRRGCPICNESHLEREVRLSLDEKGIEYTRQERFDFLGYQSVDFYLPKHNLAIECQGKQHFGIEGWKMDKELQYERDIKKAELLKEHKIGLVYYTNVEKEIALCNETRLYEEGNTHFDLEFLDALE